MEPDANTIRQMSVWIPLISALVGGVIAIAGQLVVHWIKECPKHRLDKKRKIMLRKMLDPSKMPARTQWRKLDTLSRVIGASHDETKRLLFEIEARGSTGDQDVWALIEHKPLPSEKED
ncbi:MAG: hypothetical protein IBX58_12325 [Roseovarius sp.]|nr:hypothetical protein [Roseovarius sp.]